jgi:hypothetical protein
VVTRPTASKRGILGPEAIGRVFSLRRTAPAADLAHLIERHWVVQWDLGDRPPHRQEVVSTRASTWSSSRTAPPSTASTAAAMSASSPGTGGPSG